ncbi:AraC family transcriptional regulator [Paenibacillus segetis]|uniref:HTH araC/xylS-type domain-containing protein n=1 Tax=Paenibacillus segetis TaxID=1325360 RepID=A0ABQ1YPL2_9BACL|nr:effector binding domain-containing protein [Paenibacillus segetis]GGH33839.1 hypothetical protein GCM10008013_39240 [Paenibacillus segetis]
MNYYERIQRSIDYIENNLENKIDIQNAAQESYMSLSNYYRMFFALVGYTVKEYIRCRRISLAAHFIANSNTPIIDIAVMYDFESGDSFSRAFKRITGYIPSEFRRLNKQYHFERVNILDKYFDIQDKELLDKYPDIKVLKELEPMKVAYYCYFGKEPEHGAFTVMIDWLNNSGLDINKQKLRIFGYNNPSPTSPDQKEYGYEVCVTIDDSVVVNDDKVQTKMLSGGLYAVVSVGQENNGDLGEEIAKAWGRFNNWMKDSKYVYGGFQWLEEHLGFDDHGNHTGGIELYMPVKQK